MRDAVGRHPGLTFVQGESQTVGGFGRNDRFSYRQIFGGAGEVANRVLIEAGTDSQTGGRKFRLRAPGRYLAIQSPTRADSKPGIVCFFAREKP